MRPECVICGEIHPPCDRCSVPVRCSYDAPGEPSPFCDDCEELDKLEFWEGIPRDDWEDCEILRSSAKAQREAYIETWIEEWWRTFEDTDRSEETP